MMEEVTLTTSDEEAATPTGVVILGVPVDEIPPLPWTVEALGWERYQFLSRFGGYQDSPQPSFTPSLDPRSFAHGVAYKRIEKLLLLPAFRDSKNTMNRRAIITKILDGRITGINLRKYVKNDAAFEAVTLIIEEAKSLRAFMDVRCGAPKGVPDSQGAIEGLKYASKDVRKLFAPRAKFGK